VAQLFVAEVANHRRVQHPSVCPVLDSLVRMTRQGRKEGLILLPLFEARPAPTHCVRVLVCD
jgi:hypothetical protein